MPTFIIGLGHLTWEMVERQSGRYGTVYLTKPTESGDGGSSAQDDTDPESFAPLNMDISGYGRITARVVSPRESDHVGDRIRGYYPSLPEEGEVLILGEGLAYYDKGIGDVDCFGVSPLNGRKSVWMSPENLFRCHSSVVELTWEPMEQPTDVEQVEDTGDITITIFNSGEGFLQIGM